MGQAEDNAWRKQEAAMAEEARSFLAKQGMRAIAGTLFRVTQGSLTNADDFSTVKALERVFLADAQLEEGLQAQHAAESEPDVPETDAEFNASLAARNAELQRIGVEQRVTIEQLQRDMEALKRSLVPAKEEPQK